MTRSVRRYQVAGAGQEHFGPSSFRRLHGAFDLAWSLTLDGKPVLASMSLNLHPDQCAPSSKRKPMVRVAGGKHQSKCGEYRSARLRRRLAEALRQVQRVASSPKATCCGLLKGVLQWNERFDQGRLDKAMSLNDRLLEGLKKSRLSQRLRRLPLSPAI